MPGKEIQRQLPVAAISKERPRVASLDQGDLAIGFQIRIVGLDGGCWDTVQLEILFLGSGLHHGPDVRLVPDFEVFDAILFSASPAFVVVPDDIDADLRPFPEIGRWLRMVQGFVFDADT